MENPSSLADMYICPCLRCKHFLWSNILRHFYGAQSTSDFSLCFKVIYSRVRIAKCFRHWIQDHKILGLLNALATAHSFPLIIVFLLPFISHANSLIIVLIVSVRYVLEFYISCRWHMPEITTRHHFITINALNCTIH